EIAGEANFRISGLRQQHQADVHELVLHCIGNVAKKKEIALLACVHVQVLTLAACSLVSTQRGKGCRDEARNAAISSRTLVRRSTIASTSFSSASQSFATQAGGISSAVSRMISGSKRSILDSQGSNDSQPSTSWYTQLRAYTPRSAESGKFHSPA